MAKRRFSKAYLKKMAEMKKTVSLYAEKFDFKKPNFTNDDVKAMRKLELNNPDDVTSLTDFILLLRAAEPLSKSRDSWLDEVDRLEVEFDEKTEAFFAAGNAKLYLKRQFEVN